MKDNVEEFGMKIPSAGFFLWLCRWTEEDFSTDIVGGVDRFHNLTKRGRCHISRGWTWKSAWEVTDIVAIQCARKVNDSIHNRTAYVKHLCELI